jgi:hypothetical protein
MGLEMIKASGGSPAKSLELTNMMVQDAKQRFFPGFAD